MRQFTGSHACLGTLAVCLAVLLLAWPPAVSWILAACLLNFAREQIANSFQKASDESVA